MNYEHDKLIELWKGWWKAICNRPIRTVLLILGSFVLFSGFILLTGFLHTKGTQLAEVEQTIEQLDIRLEQIADALETLTVVQEITNVRNDNSILLDYDPVPQSVRLIIGPLIHYPRPAYGYRLDGRVIHVDSEECLQFIHDRIPSGGVHVEYLRKSNLPTQTEVL